MTKNTIFYSLICTISLYFAHVLMSLFLTILQEIFAMLRKITAILRDYGYRRGSVLKGTIDYAEREVKHLPLTF